MILKTTSTVRTPCIKNTINAAICGCLIACACAHQIAPTGGPDDKTGPAVMNVSPLSGTVNVPLKTRINVDFSEWILKASAQKGVSMLPPVKGGILVKAKGKRLEIIPAEALAPGTTYHVVLTSALQDLHGNAIRGSQTFVFSTGPGLDSGKFSGQVIDPPRKDKGAMPVAALFGFERDSSDTAYWQTPDYLAQTDSSGMFAFKNIREGNYRAVAFTDNNSDGRLQPGTELAFATVSRVVTAGKKSLPLEMFPVDCDTSAPKILSVRAVSSTVVECQWTAPFDTAAGWNAPRFSLFSAGNQSAEPIGITSVTWTGGRRSAWLRLSGPLKLSSYDFSFALRRPGEKSVTAADTVRFNGTTIQDTVRPDLLSFTPKGRTVLNPVIRLVWSEPVAFTGRAVLVDSLGDTVGMRCGEGFTDTTVCSVSRSLRPGASYSFSVVCGMGHDFAGNLLKPRDSTDTVKTITVSVVQPDSLAIRLQACVPCLEPDPARTWYFSPFNDPGEGFSSADSAGCFHFDSIPHGKGTAAWFSDRNKNGRPDKGRLVPWIPGEPFRSIPDTLEARARWEVETSITSICNKSLPGTTDTLVK